MPLPHAMTHTHRNLRKPQLPCAAISTRCASRILQHPHTTYPNTATPTHKSAIFTNHNSHSMLHSPTLTLTGTPNYSKTHSPKLPLATAPTHHNPFSLQPQITANPTHRDHNTQPTAANSAHQESYCNLSKPQTAQYCSYHRR